MDRDLEIRRLLEKVAEAERQRDEAEDKRRRLQQKNSQLEQENQLQQNTTLSQYLGHCHNLLFKSFAIRPDLSGTSVTRVDGKFYPSSLRPWQGFGELQQREFEIIKRTLGDKPLFPSYIGVREMQRRACETPVANEEDIKPFEHIAVEGPVTDIIRALRAKADSDPEIASLDVSRISFANHSLSINAPVDEVIRYNTRESLDKQRRDPSPTKRVAIEPKEIRPDRRCLREDAAGNRAIAFVVEYKAAHKLQTNQVRRGLNEHLFGNTIKRRLSSKSTADSDQASEGRSDNVLAMVLIQTYDYMIKLGLEYSYLTAGKSFLVLWVKVNDPKTLYYHLIVPDMEAEDEGGELQQSRTAVAQIASFCLLALRSTTRSQSWTAKAQSMLYQWPIPYPEMQHETSDEEDSTQTLSHSSDLSYHEKDMNSPEQKVALRSRRSTCKGPEAARVKKDDSDDNDDGNKTNDDLPHLNLWSGLTTKRKDAPSSSSFEETSDSEQPRQYCTIGCLMGLKKGLELDAKCPNVALHRKASGTMLHPIGVEELGHLMQEQLACSLDRDCEPLEMQGKYGQVGTLFKLSLTQYGYTFVGKGTIPQFVGYLQYEARIYQRLERLQGEVIPVYLGSIDLIKPYNLTAHHAVRFAGTQVVHMLLLPWAGEVAIKAGKQVGAAEEAQMLEIVKAEGVWYPDVREPNQLWNEELGRFIMIDFHSAELIRKPRQVKKLAGEKRNRISGCHDGQRLKRAALGI
ncbi:hypothetical protein H9Q69_006310 [Fusarium xylarioides]|nr:hypothetical protein H9Q69_006310 [Fusarium xylarioides]